MVREKEAADARKGEEATGYIARGHRETVVCCRKLKREIRLVGILIFLGSCHVQRRGGPPLERLRDSSPSRRHRASRRRRRCHSHRRCRRRRLVVFLPSFFATHLVAVDRPQRFRLLFTHLSPQEVAHQRARSLEPHCLFSPPRIPVSSSFSSSSFDDPFFSTPQVLFDSHLRDRDNGPVAGDR